METRAQILVRGIVQGVGFRPYIFLLARKSALKGKVFNNAGGVLIDVEGEARAIDHFVNQIKLKPPPLSVIESIELNNLETPAFYRDFQIVESDGAGHRVMPVSADIAICKDCLEELFDPQNRRYRYPFINCTNCGPRFTIIEDMPYDRPRTTMRDFEMCRDCRLEYENPRDRRFHAEPICCPACGPKVFLSETPVGADSFASGSRLSAPADVSDLIKRAKQLLESGKILAVKGLGGFHLVCDALNEKAVAALRSRKHREDKPFALMANSIEAIEKFCLVSDTEKDLLLSEKRPIVLLEKKADALIPAAVAPGVKTLGFMLPYTPLHVLLLENLEKPLVMTSGNISDEPICFEDEEARGRLKTIADYYLFHNRRIHIRTDDSIVRASKSQTANRKPQILLRRSRGYAPAPIRTSFKFGKQILACGAELKNTFCLTRDDYAFVSHHIGDLENLETLKSFTTGIEHFKRLFNLEPEIIAYDLHPEYLSTKYALESEGEKIGVQHHHAHIASCLADNQSEGEVIGVAMDGSGFGIDGKLWGGEFFVADFRTAERVAHLDYIPLAGGAQAIREPWRMAAAYLQKTFGDQFLDLDLPFIQNLNRGKWKTLRSMIRTGTNCPETSSVGRLFDAVSSLLNLRNTVNYEGQAAVELEAIADQSAAKGYEFEIDERRIIRSETVVKKAVEDLLNGVSASQVAARFHLAVVDLIVRIARQVRAERHLNRVALSGGVFQNMFLLERVCQVLEKEYFEVLTHSRVPTGDGGISLGQAAIANANIV